MVLLFNIYCIEMEKYDRICLNRSEPSVTVRMNTRVNVEIRMPHCM